MKIAMRRGHQRTGSDGCAVGILNEIDVAEDYYKRAMEKFRQLGHEVLDCTPPEANRSLSDSLYYGINKANAWGADIFISCHANKAYDSYNGVIGCEGVYHRNSRKGKEYAANIEKQLSDIGFKSRGAKVDIRGLAEMNKTSMPAVIVEPFFIEATEDVAIYRRVGGEGIANAIVEGITGEKVNTPEESPQEPSNYDYSVKDKIGTVTASALNVRDGAGTEYKIIGQLVKGKKVRIGFALGDWYNVYFGDHGGWIHKNYINLENQYGVVTAKSGLKVRNGASTGYKEIGALPYGKKVEIGFSSEDGKWHNIYFGDHGGWVSADYIRLL